MKKRVLFTCFCLEMGGITKALLNLLNNIDYNKYDVTVLMQINKGELLEEINPK